MNRLREYRERYGWSQEEVVREIHRRAIQRGDPVAPGLDQPALSRHENGHKWPGPRNRELYCLVYGATPAELGFRVALPTATGQHEDVNRRDFLTGAAGLAASARSRRCRRHDWGKPTSRHCTSPWPISTSLATHTAVRRPSMS